MKKERLPTAFVQPETDTPQFHSVCDAQDTFGGLAEVTARHLRGQCPQGVEIVCMAVTSGDRIENMKRFTETVEALRAKGRIVLNQMPIERHIWRITADWQKANPARASEFHAPVIIGFYFKLFRSDIITRANFGPGWTDSKGANWEHELMMELGIPIEYL